MQRPNAVKIHCRYRVLGCELDELASVAREDRVRGDEQSVRFLRRKRRESGVDFGWIARVNDFEFLSDPARRFRNVL